MVYIGDSHDLKKYLLIVEFLGCIFGEVVSLGRVKR
jgi:hypothetical protein